jgi:hypothetical protein
VLVGSGSHRTIITAFFHLLDSFHQKEKKLFFIKKKSENELFFRFFNDKNSPKKCQTTVFDSSWMSSQKL